MHRGKPRKDFHWAQNVFIDQYAARVGPTATAVYYALCRYANHENSQCWPSVGKLATELGCSENTIRKALDALVKAGVVTVQQRRTERGKSLSKCYTLQELDLTATGAESEGAGVQNLQAPGVQNLHPNNTYVEQNPVANATVGQPFQGEELVLQPPPATPSPPRPARGRTQSANRASGATGQERPQPDTSGLLRAFTEHLGYQPANYAQEGAAARRLLLEGHSVAEILACHTALRSRWRSVGHISLTTVRTHIAAWKQNGGAGDAAREQRVQERIQQWSQPAGPRPEYDAEGFDRYGWNREGVHRDGSTREEEDRLADEMLAAYHAAAAPVQRVRAGNGPGFAGW